jgi:hypothetical protein
MGGRDGVMVKPILLWFLRWIIGTYVTELYRLLKHLHHHPHHLGSL